MNSKYDLKVASPEELGFSSKFAENFIGAMENNRICLHSFIMLRHNKIAAEGYWKPFDKNKLHRMYSSSKTFVSAAIGMLADEGKISLTDKVIKYFPDKLPEGELQPYVADMTIRDLLIMATPYSTTTYGLEYNDWAWTFFNTPTNHPAGTIFCYDTSGSYILNVIVERVTGMPFLQYLRKGLFDHIGFSADTWCVKAPEGYSWGGSGVMATTRDLAKFALVFLNEGKYNGEQLISKAFAKAATTKQIDNNTAGVNYLWSHGYGYQIWILDDGAFALRGMGSQLAICYPKKDFLFACTGDTQGNGEAERMIHETLWHEILNNLSEKMPANDEAYNNLLRKCSSLSMLPILGESKSQFLEKVNGVTYTLRDNPMQISKLSLCINGDEGILNYTNPRGDKALYFGIKKYVDGGFPETHYFGDTINKSSNRMYNTTSCAAWTEENKFVIRSFIIDDHLGNLTITLSFKNNEIGVYMNKNAEFFLNEYEGFAGGTAEQ